VAKIPSGVGPKYPHVVVLFGATGDLSRRKLLPGLFHLSNSGFIPGCRIIGISLDDMTPEAFRQFAREALDEFSSRKVDEQAWAAFADNLDYLPLARGTEALKSAVARAEHRTPHCRRCGCSVRRVWWSARGS
jgi:glucose-6-phosphate 1-dehydrogenase